MKLVLSILFGSRLGLYLYYTQVTYFMHVPGSETLVGLKASCFGSVAAANPKNLEVVV